MDLLDKVLWMIYLRIESKSADIDVPNGLEDAECVSRGPGPRKVESFKGSESGTARDGFVGGSIDEDSAIFANAERPLRAFAVRTEAL